MFKRVVLGISGGVDSAVAGLLLKQRGFDVIGVFMKNWDIEDEQGFCSSNQDAEDAQWTCKKLGIPFHQANFVKEYWNEVFTYLVDEYQNCRTPVPDIYCNKYIKFNSFIKYAEEKFGADAIATGHYSRSSFGDFLEDYNTGGAKLLQSVDSARDQTFFLSQIPQHALRKTMFPLGSLMKEVVRQGAESGGLGRVARKQASKGICFIGDRKFSSFIGQYIGDKPGDFLDLETGEKVGVHRGFHHWTLGQRAKLGGLPWGYFVVRKERTSNDIYVAKGCEHPSLYSSTLSVGPFHWIHEVPPELISTGQMECQFRFQQTSPLIDCVVTRDSATAWHHHHHQGPTQETFSVALAQTRRALTPGQFGVVYRGEECLGSAMILEAGPSLYDLHRRDTTEVIVGKDGEKL